MSATAESLPVVAPRAPDMSPFAQAQRQAVALSTSSLVPQQYRGRDNIGNVLIAMQLANRIGADVLQVMQNLHVIQGRPSLSSSFLIATVNACGRFQPLRFEVVGNDPSKKDYRVRAYAEDKASGERCNGAWITWAMVEAEGWSKKNGSKWMTMPEQMFMYRAAAFWARVYAPEVSQGIHTVEEVTDVWGGNNAQPHAPTQHGNVKALEAELTGKPAPQGDGEAEPEPVDGLGQPLTVTTKDIRARLQLAETIDEVRACDELIDAVPDDAEREALKVLQDERMVALA